MTILTPIIISIFFNIINIIIIIIYTFNCSICNFITFVVRIYFSICNFGAIILNRISIPGFTKFVKWFSITISYNVIGLFIACKENIFNVQIRCFVWVFKVDLAGQPEYIFTAFATTILKLVTKIFCLFLLYLALHRCHHHSQSKSNGCKHYIS